MFALSNSPYSCTSSSPKTFVSPEWSLSPDQYSAHVCVSTDLSTLWLSFLESCCAASKHIQWFTHCGFYFMLFMYLNLCIMISSRQCKAYENALFICLFNFTCWTQAVSCSPQKCPLAVFVTWRTEETYFWEYLFIVYLEYSIFKYIFTFQA